MKQHEMDRIADQGEKWWTETRRHLEFWTENGAYTDFEGEGNFAEFHYGISDEGRYYQITLAGGGPAEWIEMHKSGRTIYVYQEWGGTFRKEVTFDPSVRWLRRHLTANGTLETVKRST